MLKDCSIGFIGLGVMGAPMCRNIAKKHSGAVFAFDMSESACAALSDVGVMQAQSVAALAESTDIICLSLPGGDAVREVCLGTGGIASAISKPRFVIDLSTTTVASARDTADQLAQVGIVFVDAPVARTREAAQRGDLSIMVGASQQDFDAVLPILAMMGSDVTLCGRVGCGQVVKLANNALVFENTLALAEILVIAERAGVEGTLLLEAISKGSGDSFVLRNHGVKSLLPRHFPEHSFPPEYAVKDLAYLLELAQQVGVDARVTQQCRQFYNATLQAGFAGRYFPAVIEVVAANLPLAANDSEDKP
jgi:3-hydroxyisobutyrate dehydrogenase-like beta-hydroxyacid dehydrogenase